MTTMVLPVLTSQPRETVFHLLGPHITLLGVEDENKADTEAAMGSVGGLLFLHTLCSVCLVTTLLTPPTSSVLPHFSALFHN